MVSFLSLRRLRDKMIVNHITDKVAKSKYFSMIRKQVEYLAELYDDYDQTTGIKNLKIRSSINARLASLKKSIK